jgi:hypothetical protein
MHFFFLLLSEKLKLHVAAGPLKKPWQACRVLMYGSKGLMLVVGCKETYEKRPLFYNICWPDARLLAKPDELAICWLLIACEGMR